VAKIDMAKFAKFCSDTGFIFQSSSIYGGINGFWDYGPLGVVAGHGPQSTPGAGRAGNPHGRAGLLDHHESEGVGGQRARGGIQRSDGGL
jgi:hypothetical protein